MSDEITRVLDAVSDEKGEGMVRRARAALGQKDAVIKALADALVDSAPLFSVSNGPCWGCHSPVPADDSDHRDECRTRRAALRLAGRLP